MDLKLDRLESLSISELNALRDFVDYRIMETYGTTKQRLIEFNGLIESTLMDKMYSLLLYTFQIPEA